MPLSPHAAAGQQVAQMLTIVAQDSMATSMGMAVPNRNPQPEAKTEPRPPEPHPLGTARDDLDRFVGLYGDPNRTNEYRTLWVAKSCDGYLVGGVSWGDSSPWWMRSMSDAVFEAKAFDGEKLRFEFPAQPRSMVHEVGLHAESVAPGWAAAGRMAGMRPTARDRWPVK